MADPYDELLSALGYDRYTPRPLKERILRQMKLHHFTEIADYREFLRTRARELDELRDSLPVDYTTFFRDPLDWKHLATELVPKLLARKEHVRIWSAGCSTGEEAYSLAMMLSEIVGIDEVARRVTLFATDRSRTRLASARTGHYSNRRLSGVPQQLRDLWFPDDTATRKLRSVIRFHHHDILSNAPYMRIDLLLCRNVTLYLRPVAQNRALASLHLALADQGVLLSGPADGLALHRHLFTAAGTHMHTARAGARALALMTAWGPDRPPPRTGGLTRKRRAATLSRGFMS